VLIPVAGRRRQRAGALLGTGTSIVTFGLFLADAGDVIDGAAPAGTRALVLSLLGGFGVRGGLDAGPAVSSRPAPWPGRVTSRRPQVPAGRLARRVGRRAVAGRAGAPAWSAGPGRAVGGARSRALTPVLILVAATLAALGAAAAFAPPWDSFTLRTAAGRRRRSPRNAVREPGPGDRRDVIVMICARIAVVVVRGAVAPGRLAAMRSPARSSRWRRQAIWAVVQIGQTTSPLQFGIKPARRHRPA